MLLALFLPFCLFGQIQDDFSDGNFSDNPTWTGEISEFIVNATGELQLNAATAGASQLAVQGNIPDSAIWTFETRMEFSPSNSNFLRVYLMADSDDLPTASGYYLRLGEDGSNDALKLYRQDAGAIELLATGSLGTLAVEPNVQVEVKRTSGGLFSVKMGNVGQAAILQFDVQDDTYFFKNQSRFGVFCTYTDSRKDLFFFDNISILPDLPDTDAPNLLSANALSSDEIEAQFDEPLSSDVLQNFSNFSLTPNAGAVQNAALDAQNPSILRVRFAEHFQSGSDYVFSIQNHADTFGNVQNQTQSALFFYAETQTPEPNQLLINELLPDPSPSVGLPETEYIELLNTADFYIQLNELQLADGGAAPKQLPVYLLPPNSYLLLAPSAAQGLFDAALPVLYWSGFPNLNNDGDRIQLSRMDGILLDDVAYTSAWYGDPNKTDGGWALERINPTLPCLGADNWTASISLTGGTPAASNSVFDDTPDAAPPTLLSVFPQSPNTLRLEFSEGLDEVVLSRLNSFEISPTILIEEIQFEQGNRAVLTVFLSEDLENAQIYTLNATDLVVDCAGNSVVGDALSFGLPELPLPNEILFNEVLFNPASGGTRYVELYNPTDKIFQLSDFFIGDIRAASPSVAAVEIEALLLPQTFAVLSEDPASTQLNFAPPNPQWMYEQDLPSWPDEGGNVALYYIENAQLVLVDSFTFDRDLHNALLTQSDKEGVALERVSYTEPTAARSNWASAAAPNFGTPTGQNSAFRDQSSAVSDDFVSLPLARLSPDDDGFEDFLNIQFNLPQTGFSASVQVYDSQGFLIKNIERQQLIGATGSLRWDGDTDDGARARAGIHILFFEAFHADGTVLQKKIPFAVVY